MALDSIKDDSLAGALAWLVREAEAPEKTAQAFILARKPEAG
ncbi:hypothetical protein ACFVYF_31390 [Streptomyces sp. NPDC058274]